MSIAQGDMEGFTGAHFPVISAAVGSCVLVYALILDIHQVLTSLPAEALRTPVSTGVAPVLTWKVPPLTSVVS